LIFFEPLKLEELLYAPAIDVFIVFYTFKGDAFCVKNEVGLP
jgi:hypothetical protein